MFWEAKVNYFNLSCLVHWTFGIYLATVLSKWITKFVFLWYGTILLPFYFWVTAGVSKKEDILLWSHSASNTSDSFGVAYKTSVSPPELDFNFKLSSAAQLWPNIALGHVDKLPMSHLFIFLVHISTVQQVCAGEMNVATHRKEKASTSVTCRIDLRLCLEVPVCANNTFELCVRGSKVNQLWCAFAWSNRLNRMMWKKNHLF